MQRTLLLKYHQFLSAEKYPQGIRIRHGNHFFPNSEQKKSIFEIFFQKSRIVPKKELSARKNTFSQAEISYESEDGIL